MKNKNILKSSGSILAGMLIGILLSLFTDAVLEKIGIFPSFQYQMAHGLWVFHLLLLAAIYRCVYTGLGGYVTASLAPKNPMNHVRVLAYIALAANFLGLIVTWGKNLGPAWYPIALTVFAFPSTWYGGMLKNNPKKK